MKEIIIYTDYGGFKWHPSIIKRYKELTGKTLPRRDDSDAMRQDPVLIQLVKESNYT